MKNAIVKFMVLVAMTAFFSCSSDSAITNNSTADIYVSGSKADHACYWKNNQFIPLTDIGYQNSIADTIIVENNDVHITGFGDNKQLYWKNNVLTNLTDSFSTPTDVVNRVCSMDVENNDVYFAGITASVNTPTYDLVYWKNGVKTIVSTFSVQFYFNHIGIKVVNNDIYLNAPSEINGVITNGYYINGVFYPQNNGNLWGCNAQNPDVYVFGFDGGNGFYKNIITNTETTFQSISPITHMSFDNGNVYCSDALNVYRDGSLFYTIPSNSSLNLQYYNMSTFMVANNSVYAITDEGHYDYTTSTYTTIKKLLIDDVVSMQNAYDEIYSCLFVVQN
jgi:hypothetical protein